MAASSLSVIKLPIKDLGKFFLHVIFFPLIAIWMFWKVHMASKKEILEDLAKYREASDKMSSSILDISTKALEITGYMEKKLPNTDENKEFHDLLNEFIEVILEGVISTTEYSSSLRKDYRLAIEKIASSKDE
ncbi:hypothetical protein KY207_001492 [Providencia stuartii]